MRRTLCTCALLVLTVLSAACSKIFEDVGSDPHPPTIAIIGIAVYVPPVEPPPEPTPDRAAAPAQGRPIAWNSGGFTLTTGQLFQIWIAYTDAGGDILKSRLRDRDGAMNHDLTPPENMTYYPGTSGVLNYSKDGIELTGVLGPHRLELWAEDSHLSRSEKVEFVITLAP